MKWIGKRISFVEDKAKTTIVIYPENNSLVNAVMGAWVAMWLTIGGVMIFSYFTFELNEQEELIVLIFLVFWLYYAVKVSRAFAWLMWGKELLKIDEAAVHYKKSILNYGRSTPFYLENIQHFNLFVPKEKSIQSVWEASPWVRGGERLEFDYKGKIVRMGRKLVEKDAKLLFSLLNKKMEERLRKSN